MSLIARLRTTLRRIAGNDLVLFSTLVLLGSAIALTIALATKGSSLSWYFLQAGQDTGMDYFNTLALMRDARPYSNAHPIYPPMVFLVLKVIHHLIAAPFATAGASTLRGCLSATLPYLVLLGIMLVTLAEHINHQLRNHSERERKLFIAAIMLSGPMLFTIERGNVIIWALVGVALFLSLYDSETPWKRWLACVCLAFAVSIKIYPAVFAVLLLEKSRLKQLALTVVLSLAFLVLPFFLFGGLDAIWSILTGFSNLANKSYAQGTGSNFSFANLVKIISEAMGIEGFEPPSWLGAIGLLACVPPALICKEKWKKLLACGLMCIWVPSFSFTYVLIFLIPAITYLLADAEDHNTRNTGVVVLLALVFILYALPFVGVEQPAYVLGVHTNDNGVLLALTWGTVIANGALIALGVYLLRDSMMRLRLWLKGDRTTIGERTHRC